MILAVLQARMSSSRLPGKVLKEILGKPMLWRQIERIKRAKMIDKIVVATSIDNSDDAIETMCKQNHINIFRGNLNDVLDRFYQTASFYQADHIVRLTGDCPLCDPILIDSVITLHLSKKLDYTSSDACASYPDGLDVEVFSFKALAGAWQNAKLPSEREHVGPYISKNPALFTADKVYNTEKWVSEGMRWTVDEPQDFAFVTKVFEALYNKNKDFTTKDILTFLSNNSAVNKINNTIKSNEGYEKSLLEDKSFLNTH